MSTLKLALANLFKWPYVITTVLVIAFIVLAIWTRLK